jgi:acetyl-CoA C-acetyltransferase
MNSPVAIVGIGQTQYRRRHADKNTAELVRDAATAALADAGIGLDGIDLVIGGVAPDALAGLANLDLMAISRPGIPFFRVNTGGATGSSAVLAAISMIAAGRARAVLVVAVERMGHATTAQKIFNSIFDPIYEKDISMSTISMVALRATLLMQRYGFTTDHWARLAARNAAAAMVNDTIERPRFFTAEQVRQSQVLAWPIRALESCPVTEGACAVVLCDASLVGDRNPAWIHGAGAFSDTYAMGDRFHRPEGSLVNLLTLERSARKAYAQAGITDPLAALDMVEIQAPFASSEVMAYLALGLCSEADAIGFTEHAIEGTAGLAIQPSGGPQACNPVSVTALIRITEAALQIRGKAGARQLDGIRRTMSTGQGGATQFSTAIVLGAKKP